MKTCPVSSDSLAPSSSWLYLLERFDVGVVHLDRELRVLGMNDFARRSLPVAEKMPFGKIVTSFHPEAARAKVKFLLGQAECPVNNAPPMAMMINIPDRVLLIKVSKVGDAQGSQFCNLNIGDLEGRLDPQLFLRVHRSYIVNLSQVDEIVRDEGRMTLRMMGSTPADIPVSRASAPHLLAQLGLADTLPAKS
jgi:hypothetical protein